MYITAKKIKGKYKISKSHIEMVMSKYTILYCESVHFLFELGYTDSPYRVNECNIREILADEFSDELKLLFSPVEACYKYELNSLRYAMLATKNTDFKEVLKWYYQYIDSRDKLIACHNLLVNTRFTKLGLGDVSVMTTVTERVENRSKQVVFPELLLEEGYEKIEKVCTGGCVLHSLLKAIGISDDIFEEHKLRNKSIFIQGVSFEQECTLASSIMCGLLPLKTEYGSMLLDKIIKYYQTFNENRGLLDQLDFEDKIFIDALPSRVEILDKVRQRVYKNNGEELYIDNDFVYYQYNERVKDTKDYIRVGNYCNLDNKELQLKGIQGVFSYNNEEGSVPVYIDGYGMMYAIDTENLLPEISYEDVYKEFDVSNDAELYNVVSKYTNNDLTIELILALIYSRCGDYHYKYTKKVDTSSFEQSSKEAVQIVGEIFSLL